MSPRIQRSDSSMDIYNVLIMSNNSEIIFRDEKDFMFMTELILKLSGEGMYDIYAYSVLPDRANFLIGLKDYALSAVMKKINMTYAIYYNKKYSRTGHVFHDRYRSRSVEAGEILPVIRSVHQMPVIEGFASSMREYPFSSYKYYESLSDKAGLVNIRGCGISLSDILREDSPVPFEYMEKCFCDMHKIAKKLIEDYFRRCNIDEYTIKDKQNENYRRELVVLIRTNTGFSIRKISELLDINRGEVYKFISLTEEE